MEKESTEKIPYEHGDHCIFYACQDADFYFNKGTERLNIDDRYRFQKERIRRPRFYKMITGKEKERGGWLKISLQMILAKLKEKKIKSDHFYCNEDTKSIIENLNFINRENIDIRTEEEKFEVEFPVLFLVDKAKKDVSHVWFAESEEDYHNKYDQHMSKGDRIVLVAHLIKEEEN